MARSERNYAAPTPGKNGTLLATAEGQPVRLHVLICEGVREHGRLPTPRQKSPGRGRTLFKELQALAPAGWQMEGCGNVEEALKALAEKPQNSRSPTRVLRVAVVDLGLEEREGNNFVRRLRTAAPELPILALSQRTDERCALAALMAGASGHLSGPRLIRQVLRALEHIVRGERILSRRSHKAMVRMLGETDSLEAGWNLTPKQQDVMSGLLRGLPNKEIAAEMGTADGTVHSQLKEIYRKMDVHSRGEAVSKYLGMSDTA